MSKTWKALGSVIVAAALVAAPLSMASAEETPPPDDTAVVTTEVVEVSADAVDDTPPAPEVTTQTYPNPNPSGSYPPKPPEPCTDEASRGGYGGHNDCVPNPGPRGDSGSDCTAPGQRTFWSEVETPYWSDETHEWLYGEPVRTVDAVEYDVHCSVPVHPPVPTWVDECGPGNGHWVYEDVEGNGYKYYEYTDGQGRHWITVLPEKVGDGYFIPADELFLLHERETNTAPCTVPVPALFAADPTPPTCDTAGALPDLSEVFPNVSLSFDRPYDGPGTYTLTATALNGFEFEGGGTVRTREITVDGALGYQSTDSEAPCFVPLSVVPVPEAPTFDDPCGIDNDSYTVPGDTEEFTYEVVEDGDTVTITAVLRDPEGDEFPEDAVTEWSFTFTDEACPTPVVPPVTPPALAATGGGDVSPLLPAGAGALVIAGAALMVLRRFVRP